MRKYGVLYVRDSNILNDSETLKLVKAAQQGDSKALSSLVVIASPSVHAQAKKIFVSTADHDDLYQEGMFALLNAVKTYDAKQGASFSTYVNLLVRRRLISFAKRTQRGALPQISAEPEELNLTDCSVEDRVFQEENYRELVGFIKDCLSDKEQEALKLFLNGFSYTEIAEKMGVTKKAVDGTLQRARKKLKGYKRLT